MKKTLLFIIICGIFLVVVPLVVNAQTVEIPNPLDCDDAECIVDKIAIAIRPIAVAVAIVMIIISGIQYITSTGDEEKIKRAKKTMLYTVIGLVIVIMASFLIGILGEIFGFTNGGT